MTFVLLWLHTHKAEGACVGERACVSQCQLSHKINRVSATVSTQFRLIHVHLMV